MEKKGLIVLSASRRTDMVGWYPEVLIERLRNFPSEEVHSIVIWTKNPKKMVEEGTLRKVLKEYRQVVIHFTITGMGGGMFEPKIPHWKEAVQMIDRLLELVGDPQRIYWRFDPILEVEGNGRHFSNFDYFEFLAGPIASFGVKSCRVSWVSPYKKVQNRLAGKGWSLVKRSIQERKAQANLLAEIARHYGMSLYFCSMEGFPISACIDGEALNRMHPEGLSCSKERAKGQRPLCGCTASLDLGWYSLKCGHGCLYCYAAP